MVVEVVVGGSGGSGGGGDGCGGGRFVILELQSCLIMPFLV